MVTFKKCHTLLNDRLIPRWNFFSKTTVDGVVQWSASGGRSLIVVDVATLCELLSISTRRRSQFDKHRRLIVSDVVFCLFVVQRWSICRVARRAMRSTNYATVLSLLSVYDVPTTTNTNASDVRRKRLANHLLDTLFWKSAVMDSN